jgi:nucleoside-diphosphate-sugar epimerase
MPSPNNFYGLTKLVGEETVRFHSLNAGFGHVIFRLFNVYSQDQPPGLLVGDVMEKYRKGGIIEVHNPQAVLDMVHLEDVVNVLSSTDRIAQGTYNLCSGHPITVGQIYEGIGSYLGKAGQKKTVSDKKEHLLGDNSRLRSLGFSFRPFRVGN